MKQYKNILKYLEQKGIQIQNSRYDEEAMGSWYIVTDSKPSYRIVHDGRDKTIVLEIFKSEWKSILADKTQSGKYAISKLILELKDS